MYKVLVAAPFTEQAKKSFEEASNGQCQFTYAGFGERDITGYDIVLGNPPQQSIIDASDRLKWVQLLTSGTDRYNADFPKNIKLTNATGIFGESISQHVLACILALYRRLPEYLDCQRQSMWNRHVCTFGKSLKNRRVLILGAGDIGTCTARLLRPFGTYNIGVKRTANETSEPYDEMHSLNDIDTLLNDADIIVGCLPSTKATYKLLNRDRIAKIKKGAVIVNVGRGTLIDTEALTDALESGQLGGAALDVTDPEPLPESSRLWGMKNVIITPHVSGPSLDENMMMSEEISALCRDNIRAFLAGEKMKNNVDLIAGYAVKE